MQDRAESGAFRTICLVPLSPPQVRDFTSSCGCVLAAIAGSFVNELHRTSFAGGTACPLSAPTSCQAMDTSHWPTPQSTSYGYPLELPLAHTNTRAAFAQGRIRPNPADSGRLYVDCVQSGPHQTGSAKYWATSTDWGPCWAKSWRCRPDLATVSSGMPRSGQNLAPLFSDFPGFARLRSIWVRFRSKLTKFWNSLTFAALVKLGQTLGQLCSILPILVKAR